MGFQKTHGKYGTKVYVAWRNMLKRCRDPKHKSYHNYGGRGIGVHPSFLTFAGFYAEVGDPPSPRHSLERLRRDDDYEPGNVVWATPEIQSNNRRKCVYVVAQGKRYSMAQWAKKRGMNYFTLYDRIVRHGWDPERALTEPVGPARAPAHGEQLELAL